MSRYPPALTDPSLVREKVDEYLEQCRNSRREFELKNGSVVVRYEQPATMIGLAVHLNIRKDVLYSYLNKEPKQGVDDTIINEIGDCLARARDEIESMTLSRSAVGDYDPKIATLILNGFGYAYKGDQNNTVLVKIQGANSDEVDEWSK